jgi:hypothetical protein
VTRGAAPAASYLAAERCQVVAAPDGACAAIVEAGRVVVVELRRATVVAEVGVATAREHTDVAWILTPSRLLILSRHPTHSTLYLIDLEGPRVRAEIQIERAMRIGTTVGTHALLLGADNAGSSVVLTAGDAQLIAYPFASQAQPSAVGAAGHQFVVAIPGAIEEWDPRRRAPRNRMRLPHQARIAQLGGTERVVWMTTHQAPTHIDVIPRIHGAQSRSHALPEPISHVSAHPRRDLLACLGRDTGRIYVVDLDGRAAPHSVSVTGLDRADAAALFVGASVGIVAARAGKPLGLAVLEPHATPASSPSSLPAPRPPTAVAPADATAPAPHSARAAPPTTALAPADGPPRFAAGGGGLPGALGPPVAARPVAPPISTTGAIAGREPGSPPPDLAGSAPASPPPDLGGEPAPPASAAGPGSAVGTGRVSQQLRATARVSAAMPRLRRPLDPPLEPVVTASGIPRPPSRLRMDPAAASSAPRRMTLRTTTLTARAAGVATELADPRARPAAPTAIDVDRSAALPPGQTASRLRRIARPAAPSAPSAPRAPAHADQGAPARPRQLALRLPRVARPPASAAPAAPSAPGTTAGPSGTHLDASRARAVRPQQAAVLRPRNARASRPAAIARHDPPATPTAPVSPIALGGNPRTAARPQPAALRLRGRAHAPAPAAPHAPAVPARDARDDPAGRPAQAGSRRPGSASAAGGPPRLRRLGSEPIEPPASHAAEASGAAGPPAARPIVRPPIASAIAALAPRTPPARCGPDEYEALLEHYRRYVADTTLLAIAHDWDRGRLAFATTDRPFHETEVLGIVGWGSGLAPAMMREAIEAREAAAGALQRAWTALAGRLSPFDVICAEYGLGKLGELVLLFVAAPALWGELARLYRILAHDSGRAPCDEYLLWQLLGRTAHRAELARELDPDGPLRRHGLIQAGDRGRPFQPLAAHPTVVKLLASAAVDDDLPRGVARVPARVALDQLMIPTAVIDRALADLAASPAGRARVVVAGHSGAGRRSLLASLAELAGRTLATIDGAMLIREQRLDALAGLLQQAHLSGWLPCVDGLDTIASDDAATRASVRELLRDHPGPLAVRLPRHVQPPVQPGYVRIELPTSTIGERAAQWSATLASAGLVVRDLDALAARFTVGPGTIQHVVSRVARSAPPSVDRAIEAAVRQYLESKLGAVATRVTRLASWSQIVLPADIQDSLVELVARIRHRRTVYDTWGFDQVMSTSRGLIALFEGGPGTGKTLVAGAIANELGLDLYRIDLSRVMSKWIGETEQNLARVFDAAEQGQALILFDEADSLFGKRTEVRTAVDRYANLETNYLLQRLDSFEGVAVLTTNFGTAIDAAFKRRLSCRLSFPLPDEEARARLWRIHLPAQLPTAGELDLAELARRYQMSGGYIRNAALRAAFLAAEDHAPLSQDHLERAVRAEFREGGKLAESGVLE